MANGCTQMDGPVGVSQCQVSPGSSFTYNFTVDQPGTYWYHSHVRGQYPDGLRGVFLVHDKDAPFQFDQEIPITLSDWYHDQMPDLIPSFISVTNPTGAEPVPDAALMNDSQNTTFAVQPNKTYFLRIVNMAAFAAQYFWIEGHNMTVVEVDGVYTQPMITDMLLVTAAQRYGVLLTTLNTTDANFPIVGSMDTDLFDTIPDSLNYNVTSFLQYSSSAPLPDPQEVDQFDPMDDMTLVPYDQAPLLPAPAQSITLDLTMDNLGDGANYAFFNDITYVAPRVPTLYSVLSTGANATNPVIYSTGTNPLVLNHLDVVELVLNNQDTGKHPFHLHGHAFQAIIRADDDAGDYDPTAVDPASLPAAPMRRDTLMVRPTSHFVIRFRADNPGVWLFHCHIEWHVDSGLIATVIEAPLEIQAQNLAIPADHYDACRSSVTPFTGNAAGNTVDLTDMTGLALAPAPLPAGFTPRGIVALVFSCISAFLGMAVIGWYGAVPISRKGEEELKRRIEGS